MINFFDYSHWAASKLKSIQVFNSLLCVLSLKNMEIRDATSNIFYKPPGK